MTTIIPEKITPRRAKYTHRTKLCFMLCVFRDCIELSPSKIRIVTMLLFSGVDGFSVPKTDPENPYAAGHVFQESSRNALR